MQERTKLWLTSLLLLSFLLSACNFGQEPQPTQDVGPIFTAAAETVQAQFASQLTQTALAAPTATIPPLPPTATPFPTFAIDGSKNAATTPLPTLGVGTQQSIFLTLTTPSPVAALATEAGQACNNSAFIDDITYPDGTEVKADKRITKIWRIQNTGTCTWSEGYKLVQYSGDNMNATKWFIFYDKEFVKPDKTVDISVEMTTPSTKGEHGGCWRLQGDDGYYFGTPMCILITVK